MMMGGTVGQPWKEGEKRESVLVFIGRNLPRAFFEEGLALCAVGAQRDPLELLKNRSIGFGENFT